MTSTRERLEIMNRACEAFCRGEGSTYPNWKSTGPKGTPNFRLIYSSAETFDQPGGIMLLGTNPGGDEINADIHDPWVPFLSPHYSSYCDDFWASYPKGQHPMQRAAQSIAAAFAGTHEAGTELLRTSPSGNLIPFRSENLPKLPRQARERGFEIGWELIAIARPRVLVLLSSNASLWDPLMLRAKHSTEPDWSKNLGANFIFREARLSEEAPFQFAFALPGANTSKQARTPEVLALLRQRIAQHGLALR